MSDKKNKANLDQISGGKDYPSETTANQPKTPPMPYTNTKDIEN